MKIKNILIASTLLITLLAFAGCSGDSPSTTVPAATTAIDNNFSRTDMVAGIESTLEDIYNRVNPSVVNINVLEEVDSFSGLQIPGFSDPGQQFTQGLGSGFLWDTAGHIVTNNHVVANADNISVTFYDGTTVQGTVVGTDADSDLAVVKVDLPALQIKPVQMADSTQLKVGQLAIAIGNPFGLQSTMTVGFISGLGRVMPSSDSANPAGGRYSIPDIIQTDASINPGNSGGVLLDADGKVIGVTSSIATTSGSSAGVGFAIPSTIVAKVVPDLIKNGRYEHPYLGLSLLSMTPDIASAMGLPSGQRGTLVESVTSGGPSDKAGLKGSDKQITINGQQIDVGGDVIIAYNGQTVKSSDDLITYLARSGSAGQTVTLTVLRDGKQEQVQVTLGVRPGS